MTTANAPEELGVVGKTTFALAVEPRPWTLSVEALVVGAHPRTGLGPLGRAVRDNFPSASWKQLDYRQLDPLTPQIVSVPDGSDSAVCSVLVATVRVAGRGTSDLEDPLANEHGGELGGGRLSRAMDAATVAVRRAQELGLRSVALPLLGTAADGLPVDVVATQMLRKLVVQAQLGGAPEQVVVLVDDKAYRRYVRAGWADAVTATARGTTPSPWTQGEEGRVLRTAERFSIERRVEGVEGLDILLAAWWHAVGSASTPGRTLRAFTHRLGIRRTELLAALEEAGIDPAKAGTDVPRTGTRPRYEQLIATAEGVRALAGDLPPGIGHLLAAAVLGTSLPVRVLAPLRSSQDELIEALRDTLLGSTWARVFDQVELSGRFVGDRVPHSEDEEIADHLGVDVHVAMLAGLVARQSTAMPVSIGLFGEWGSGKSHFMELMRRRVRELAGAGPDYHDEIVQLTFNAWHYADTNLWASLAGEFFRQLARPEIDPVPARREAIATRLREHQQLRVELSTSLDAARDRTEDLAGRLAQASTRRATSSRARSRRLLAATATQLLKAEPEQVKSAATDLGFTSSDAEDHAAAVLARAREVRDTVDDAAAVRRLLSSQVVRRAFGFLLVCLVGVAAAVALPSLARWLGAGAGLSLTAALALAGQAVGRARDLAARLRSLAVTADAIAADAEQDEELAPLTLAVQEAEAEEAMLRAEADRVAAVVAELDRELVDLAPDQRLYRFVAERAGSDDYATQLGVISTVRRDFEELVALMHAWRRDASPSLPDPIDRIVLYIDDLDRCEPEQVVAVLQAVHLLLAMDLFVVVVGVDPHWLHRSLAVQYRATMGEGSDPTVTTPQHYLEKIFQIPFTLPVMRRKHLGRLLRHLSGVAEPPDAVVDEPDSRPVAAPEIGAAADEAAPTSTDQAPISLEPRSPTSSMLRGELGAATRGITRDEIGVLEALSGLVTSPREATRLLNLYGLLRSTRDLHDGAPFLGGHDRPGAHQAVAQLLGVLIGHPRLFGQLVWGTSGRRSASLTGTKAPALWPQFVASLRPATFDGDTRNAVAVAMSESEALQWARLTDELDRVLRSVTLHDVAVYRLWAPRVARFSFNVLEGGSSDAVVMKRPEPPDLVLGQPTPEER